MKRLFFIIIGILLLLIGSVGETYAQSECINDPYSPEFNCGVSQFCDPGSPHSRFSLYHNSYCALQQSTDREEEIYEAVAIQFNLDPGIFADGDDIIAGILKGEIGPQDIPDPLLQYFQPRDLPYLPGEVIETMNFNRLTDSVIAAYEKEKVIYAMKESFKQEFENSEEWYDATLLNSPMDLVVDLNLIDIMLFGSGATWNNDVYKFPSDEEGPPEVPALPSPGPGATEEGAPEIPDEEEPTATEEPPFDPARDCMPPDDPTAQQPSPGDVPANCGNSQLDEGEGCDDGNNQSGDGCANTCTLEGSGSLVCRDPEVVTFKDFEPSTSMSSSGLARGSSPDSRLRGNDNGESGNDISCPSGTLPRQALSTPILRVQEVPQAPNYPGPFIGGVLKEFPPSKKPPCPPGESELKVSALDLSPIVDLKAPRMKEYNLGNEVLEATADTLDKMADVAKELGRQDDEKALREAADKVRERSEEPVCIPTELCADFDDSRDFLFGDGWREDEDKKKIAQSIELMFCVEVKKEMRPETPYALNEGCIDCHIRAMVNTLDKLFENTIAPLENTQSAFSISNRWGPKFSFDLNVSVQGKTKLSDLANEDSAIAQASREIQKRRQEQTKQVDPNKGIAHPSSNREANLDELLNAYNNFEKAQTDKYLENLKFYRFNSDTTKQTQFAGRVGELFVQWRDSFAAIQDVYVGIAESIKFSKKKKCEF